VRHEGHVLVDSSAWIHALRPGDDARFRGLVDSLLASGSVATCEIVVAELLRGARSDEEFARLREALGDVAHLDLAGVGYAAGELALRLRGAGITIPTTDLLIAATASHHGVSLLHRDKHLALAAEALAIPVWEPA